MTVLFNLTGLVSDAWFVTLGVSVFVLAGLYFYDSLGANDRAAIAGWLRAPGSDGIYTYLVGGALNRVDWALTPESVEDVPDPAPGKRWWRKSDWITECRAPTSMAAKASARAAFGWPLFNAALRFALVYPLALLVVFWAATGDAGRVGPLEVLPAAAPTWQRVAAIGLLVVVLLHRNIALLFPSPARPIGQLVVLALGTAGAGATLGPGVAIAVGAVGFAVAVSMPFGVAVPVALALAYALALTLEGAVALESAVALVLALLCGIVGALGLANVSVGAAASCVRTHRAALGYGGLVVLLMLWLTLASALGVPPTSTLGGFPQEFLRTWLIFLALLPLVNACFDFASIGTTRWLVRAGAVRHRWALVLALVDVIAAAGFFTALGCTLIAVLHGLNSLAEPDLLDLQSLFDGLRTTPGQYWWLYATIFTTLAPTFLHFAAAGCSAIAWLPRVPKRRLLRHVERASEWAGHRWIASLALAAIATVAILVPVFMAAGAALLLYHFYPEVGGGYLRVFEWFARWIGATVEPGPLIIGT
jgi:hypothetical protein